MTGDTPAESYSYDLYEVLGLDWHSAAEYSRADIVVAYRKRALECHPDKCKKANAHEEFIKVSKAFTVLGNDKSRDAYNYLRRAEKERKEKERLEREAAAERDRIRRQKDADRRAEEERIMRLFGVPSGISSSKSRSTAGTLPRRASQQSFPFQQQTPMNGFASMGVSGNRSTGRGPGSSTLPRRTTSFAAFPQHQQQQQHHYPPQAPPAPQQQQQYQRRDSSGLGNQIPKSPPPFFSTGNYVNNPYYPHSRQNRENEQNLNGAYPANMERKRSFYRRSSSGVRHTVFADIVQNYNNLRQSFRTRHDSDNNDAFEDEKDRQFMFNGRVLGELFQLDGCSKVISWHADGIYLLVAGEDNDADLVGHNGTLTLRGTGHTVKIMGNGWTVLMRGKDHRLNLNGRDGRIRIRGKRHHINLTGDGGTVEVSGKNYDIEILADNVKCYADRGIRRSSTTSTNSSVPPSPPPTHRAPPPTVPAGPPVTARNTIV